MRRRAGRPLPTPVKAQRVYTDAFVRDALEAAAGGSVNQTARDLGVPRTTLQQWIRGERRTTRSTGRE